MSTSGSVLVIDLIHLLTITSVLLPADLLLFDFLVIVGLPDVVAFVDSVDFFELWLFSFDEDFRCRFWPSWELCELIRSSSCLATSSGSKSTLTYKTGLSRCTSLDRACRFVLFLMPTMIDDSKCCFVDWISAFVPG